MRRESGLVRGLDLRRTAQIVDAHPALRLYAIILSLCHALTGSAWFAYRSVAELTTRDDAVCWPLFPNCRDVRAHLSADGVRDLVLVYMLLGVCAAALFYVRNRRAALPVFALATLLGTAIYALDYRLRFNQTYMFGWVVLAFLFAPKRPQVLSALVALFYLWAGTLKVNAEWLSGAALYAKPLFVPESLVPASCAYVLVLELVLVWALFAERLSFRYAVYPQLVLFHVVSWSVVGYFYPILMFGLGAIYPLVWGLSPKDALTLRALRRDRDTRVAVLALAALFSLFQLVPHLFPGDTALTGEGRLFALHMFDAKIECAGGATLRSPSGQSSFIQLVNDAQDLRTRCDPIVLRAQAERVCRSLQGRPDHVRVDVSILAKRTTDAEMRPLIVVDDFCSKNVAYSVFRHNSWIGAR